MKSLLIATALAVALPAVAHAQTAPAPAPKMECCEKMKADGKDCCCKDMAKKDHSGHGGKAGSDPHAGHAKTQPGASPPTPDAGSNHQH